MKYSARPGFSIIGIVACFALGCDSGSPHTTAEAPVVPAPSLPSATTTDSVAGSISDEEAKQFAKRFLEAIERDDAAALPALFNQDRMWALTLEGIESVRASKVPRPGKGAITHFLNTLIHEQHSVVVRGGSYDLLRIHDVDGQKRALFRIACDDGVNYHDVILGKNADGSVRGIDIDVFAAGERSSASMRRLHLQFAADETTVGRLAGRERLYVTHFKEINGILAGLRGGAPAEAIQIFRSLPRELQIDRHLMLFRIQATMLLQDDSEFALAVKDFRDCYPGEPCTDLMSIHYYLLRKKFEKALEAIDAVDKAVGGDPYLCRYKGEVLAGQGRIEEAASAFDLAVNAVPEIQDVWWGRVSFELEQQKFDDVLADFKQIDSRFRVEWQNFNELPAYAEFVKSPQYQEWLRYLAAKSADAADADDPPATPPADGAE